MLVKIMCPPTPSRPEGRNVGIVRKKSLRIFHNTYNIILSQIFLAILNNRQRIFIFRNMSFDFQYTEKHCVPNGTLCLHDKIRFYQHSVPRDFPE